MTSHQDRAPEPPPGDFMEKLRRSGIAKIIVLGMALAFLLWVVSAYLF